jgi:hypothetical protein
MIRRFFCGDTLSYNIISARNSIADSKSYHLHGNEKSNGHTEYFHKSQKNSRLIHLIVQKGASFEGEQIISSQ